MLIPRIFHIIWVGPEKFPKEYLKYRHSWLAHNPSWKLMFWTDKNIPKLLNQAVYDKMETYAGKADILRLELLYTYGGVYSDADSECLKNIEPLIKDLTAFGMTGNGGNIANGTLGCVQNHLSFKTLVQNLLAHIKEVRSRDSHTIYDLAGTNYITPILRKDSSFLQIDAGTKLKAGRELICRSDERTSKTYIIHYNKKSWTKPKGRVKK
jgi:mannosyltransferase OCH1-like enzyme